MPRHTKTSRTRRVAGFVALLLAAAGAVAVWMLNRDPAPKPYHPGPSPRGDALAKLVYPGYAGSPSCRDCHEEAFELWEKSNHGLAERNWDKTRDGRAFNPSRTFSHGTQQTRLGLSNGIPQVTAVGLQHQPETFDVTRVIGNNPLQQFLVAFQGGRLQTLEASYDPRSNQWFNVYGAEDRQPGEWGHWTGRGMNWNSECAACHNTRLLKNYEATNDSYHTVMAEMSVGCEACHGPLRAHNEWQARFGKSGRKDPTVQRLPRSQVVEYCAFCHSRRGELDGDFWPGELFLDHCRLTIPDGSEVFYADGQVHEEDYEYAAFLGSRMHARGVTCLDCHNPHSAKTILPGNWLCMRCHNGSYTNAPVIAPVAHSRHKVFGYDTNGVVQNVDLMSYHPDQITETGGECVNCHMPQTTYMQRHRRHDHGFTIPDPLLTLQNGIPNACNRCHADKDAAWSLQYCTNWYGQKMDRPSRHRAQLVAAARAGDAAAAAGLAWQLATNDIPYWRAVAAGLLGTWAADPAIQKALLDGLGDSNALVRAECARSLESSAATRADVASQLSDRLADPVRDVRLAAAWSLRQNIPLGHDAARELLEMLANNADQPPGQMQLALFSLARTNADAAVAHCKTAVAWDPNSAAIRRDYAILLSTLNRLPEAVEQLQAAVRLEPRNAELHYNLALGWNELGKGDQTISELRTAVALDPAFARAWYNLGLALDAAGQSADALGAFAQSESADPSDPSPPYARALVLARLGRTDEARRAAARALALRPDFAPARQLLSQLR
ncbi:MAG: ammonia-forming cytochrome c nitrite reductase subunit c552 [Verrucomicrobiota bacterium]